MSDINHSTRESDVDIPDMVMDTEARMIIDGTDESSADFAQNHPLEESRDSRDSMASMLSNAESNTFKSRCIKKLDNLQWLSLFSYNTGIYHNGRTKYSSACATFTSILFVCFVVIYTFSEIFTFDDILSVIVFEENKEQYKDLNATVVMPNATDSNARNFFDLRLSFSGLKCADLTLQNLVYDNKDSANAFFTENEKSCNQTTAHATYYLTKAEQLITYTRLTNDPVNWLVVQGTFTGADLSK